MRLGLLTRFLDGGVDYSLIAHPSGMVWLADGEIIRRFDGDPNCDLCLGSPFGPSHYPSSLCRQSELSGVERLHCNCKVCAR